MATARTAKDVIAALNLVPHPEKGFFVETFRDPAASADGRAASTYIYYLLEGEAGLSHWHRVLDAVEVWHYYAGAPLQLSLSRDDGEPVIVERGEWQHALSLGDWTLIGCSVAPAFDFKSFEMAKPGWEPEGAGKQK
ncbi:hypothetical protein C2857_000394 [Epichloe festucae Fl1]|uniref:DUF985 domain-containing protein n=1 Tax=Epichloe festucae (strain Fl1) TaxID=877507 RepID=A0A7U3SND9_EPIFF|nr:hypothetical protein C2857_000394 [Epichloe festucae Fl1]